MVRMEFLDTIRNRRSSRKFKDKDVPDEIIMKLLDAARHAPSSMNSQPWEFIVVRDKKTKEKIAASRGTPKGLEVQASVVIIICVDTDRSKTRWVEDGSVAGENLLLAAASLGLSGIWHTGWCGFGKTSSPIEETIRTELKLPQNVRPVTSIAIGWPAEPAPPKQMRDLNKMVHMERF